MPLTLHGPTCDGAPVVMDLYKRCKKRAVGIDEEIGVFNGRRGIFERGARVGNLAICEAILIAGEEGSDVTRRERHRGHRAGVKVVLTYIAFQSESGWRGKRKEERDMEGCRKATETEKEKKK